MSRPGRAGQNPPSYSRPSTTDYRYEGGDHFLLAHKRLGVHITLRAPFQCSARTVAMKERHVKNHVLPMLHRFITAIWLFK
jgi:hypothetical protein